METELKLPSEWPEDFIYTDEGGLTPEQAAERMSTGAMSWIPTRENP